MTVTIDELLNALQNPDKVTLENNKDTWSRIGNKDSFEELGLEPHVEFHKFIEVNFT